MLLVHLIQTIHGRRTFLVVATVGLSIGPLFALLFTLSNWVMFGQTYRPGFWLDHALVYALPIGPSYGLLFGLISVLVSTILKAHARGITLTERLQWTWTSLMRSLFSPNHVRATFFVGGLVGLSYGLSVGLSGLPFGVINVDVYIWLGGGPFGIPLAQQSSLCPFPVPNEHMLDSRGHNGSLAMRAPNMLAG